MKNNTYGTWGIIVGGLGLMLALVHFWAGPFSSKPSLETVVAEKAASIRQKTIDAITGKTSETERVQTAIDADKIASILTAVFGGIAFILAALSFSNHESKRAAGSAAVLGVSAIAFQFIAMYAMALLVILLILGALSIFEGAV